MPRLAGMTVAALLLVAAGCSSPAPAGPDADPPASAGGGWSPAARDVGGLRVLAESDADGFRLHTASGDKSFLPGVNLGSTVPLQQPGEIGTIPGSTYAGWLSQMGDLGIRAVRIYTLPPPAFYDELDAYNRAHPADPIYLVQGVYLPDESYVEAGGSLYDPAVDDAFAAELQDVSDAVHGDLERDPAPGRASGTYRTDVSAWLAAWIVGVEWDPAAVRRTDRQDAGAAYEPGDYFVAQPEATATERWLARHMDALAAAEAARGTSVPVAMVNWPTLDPLEHPEEPDAGEDLLGVDAAHVLPTDAWPGGTFASFHAYPYYPDFQRYEPGLQQTEWNGRADPYAGYVAALREHFAATMPLMVTEVGVPSALGSAHRGPLGRDQGAHTEQEAMATDADLLRLLQAQGAAGGFVFSWEDEWFKATWNTAAHQDPERRQLWHDPLTNEQWFGLMATDPDPLPDATAELAPDGGAFERVRVWADASWVHLDVTVRDRLPARLRVEADVVPGPDAADYRVEVDAAARAARLDVRRELDPIRLDTAVRPYRAGQDEPWHLYSLLTREPQTVGTTTYEAEYEDVGLLVEGQWDPAADAYDSTSTWQLDEDARTVRLRLPWSMLGLADPSARTALGEGEPAALVPIGGIGLTFDADGAQERLDFTWPTWNSATYRQRPKAGLDVVEQAFRDLAP